MNTYGYRKITWKKLMEKIEEGYAEVTAWASEMEQDGWTFAQVTFYNSNGKAKREQVAVTSIPADERW